MIERIDSYKTSDGEKLELTFEEVEDDLDGVVVRTEGMPFLRDRRSGRLYKPPFTDCALKKLVEIAKKNKLHSIDGISPPASYKE